MVEAKPNSWGAKITTVEDQSAGYAAAQLKWVKNPEPLPFIYEATGQITRFTDAGATEGLRTSVQIDDVLVTITDGKCHKNGYREPRSWHGLRQPTCRLVPTGPQPAPRFPLLVFAVRNRGRRQLNAAAYEAGKPGLNLENIREVTLKLPYLGEQDEIVAHISALLSDEENISQTIQNKLARITALRQSILKKAFSGQLVPQDPADEPASALLAGLAATAPKPRRKTTK